MKEQNKFRSQRVRHLGGVQTGERLRDDEGETLQGMAGLTGPTTPGLSMRLPVVVAEVEMGFWGIRQSGRNDQKAPG